MVNSSSNSPKGSGNAGSSSGEGLARVTHNLSSLGRYCRSTAVGPAGARSYSLAHYDGDLFLTFPDAETPDRPTGVSFVVGPDGKASAMTIGFLDENHLGTLRRVGD